MTFNGGRTRAVDVNGLLEITLSDGTWYTPSTNSSSSSRPIVLPVEGQSFADISMSVPTDTNSVALSTLIGPPSNYWRDDDGDSDVTVTGTLSLSIVDKNNQVVSRNTVLTTCNDSAPYRIKLSSTNGTLSTRYGFPNRSTFNASNVTYYVNPKAPPTPVVCFARPFLNNWSHGSGPSWMFDFDDGFIPQSTSPSRYGQNFPTTGANGFKFDLLIGGVNQPLSWSPVSRGRITATMTNSTTTSVHVTLTGPYATTSQHSSSSPGPVSTPPLPQTFELVGRDNNGTPVVKYGFTLKQWFVSRGRNIYTYPNTLSWCNRIGYRLVKVKDLTNAVRTESPAISGATPSSSGNHYQRRIGSGFLTEWGSIPGYSGVDFGYTWFWTSDRNPNSQSVVNISFGSASWTQYNDHDGLCAYP